MDLIFYLFESFIYMFGGFFHKWSVFKQHILAW